MAFGRVWVVRSGPQEAALHTAVSAPRIAVLIPDLSGGGAQRVTTNLIAALATRGVKVDLLMVRAEGANLARVPAEVRKIELGTRRTLRSIPAVTAYLRQHRPQALLAVMDAAGVVAVVARRLARVETRLVVVVHSATIMRASAKIPWGEQWLPVLLRSQLWPADAIVAVSDGVAEELRRVFPWLRRKVQMLYNPVVTKQLLQQAELVPDHPWLQQRAVPVILGVGRLCAAKGFATLIRAFATLAEQRPARLIIYGDGELRHDLEALVAELGLVDLVRLPGWTDNPWAALRQAALFALSSEYEALPTVLIEAMACGTPVVATDCRFGPREVLRDGQLGPLVAPRDPRALAHAMANTLEHPTPAAQLQARAAAFSDSACLDRYLGVLLGPQ